MAGRPVSEDSKRIAARMKQILRQKGIRQEQAYFRLGVGSQAVLSNYINGNREIPMDFINRFCAEFGVPVATLFADDDITINTENDMVLDIMLAIDEFLAENHLALTGEQRKNLAKDFLAKDCHDADRIKDTLSALRAINSGMFLKRK
jgi:transcriptional regulator with XRE-family HTH domain